MTMNIMLFPDEIQMDIFLRLPVKSLLVVRCVCKHWHALTKTQCFLEAHLNQERNKLSFIIQSNSRDCQAPLELCLIDGSDSDHNVKIQKKLLRIYPNITGTFHMLASCNGLVCFEYIIGDQSQICILNPTIEEFTILPHSISAKRRPDYGFGFDPSQSQYKVVRVSISKNSAYSRDCEIFALGKTSWKMVGTFPYPPNPFFPIFVSGAFHWMLDIEEPRFILSMNIDNNMFQEIQLPELYSKSDGFIDYQLVELNDLLSLFSFFDDGRIEIWILMDRNNSIWTKRHCINLGSNRLPYINSTAVRNDEILFVGSNKLLSHNMKSHITREVDASELGLLDWPRVQTHVKSVISCKSSDKELFKCRSL